VTAKSSIVTHKVPVICQIKKLTITMKDHQIY